MLSIAREDGKIQAVPVIRMQKEPPPRKGFLTNEQCDKLLAALPAHLRPLALYQYWCGGRKGEAFQIDWSQVDLKGCCIRLEGDQTKNEEPRIVPLPPVLVDILEQVQPKTGLVFDTTNLREEWGKACDAVGFGKREKQKSSSGNTWYRYSGLTIHDFRRSATRNLVNALIPENVAMKITGHKTRSVFDPLPYRQRG
jgi:integrase